MDSRHAGCNPDANGTEPAVGRGNSNPQVRARLRWLMYWLAAMALPVQAAADYNLELGAGLQYSDNVDRTDRNERHDWILVPSISAFWNTESPTFEADLSGRITYLEYLRGTNDSSFGGDLSLVSAWEVLPERLELHLQNQYSEVAADQQGALTPGNRELVNAVLFGPDLILRPSPVDRLVLGARVGHAYFEESLNNTRQVGVVRWEHRFSTRTEAYLEGTLQYVQFQGDEGADFDRQDSEIGITHQFIASRLRLSGGVFRVNRDEGSDVDGYEAEVAWDRDFSQQWRLSLAASRNTFDAGNRLLASGPEALALGSVSAGFDDDLVTTDLVGATLRRERDRQQLYLGVSHAEESFEDTGRDRDVTAVQAGLDLGLRPGMQARLTAWYSEFRYDQDSRRDEELIVGVSLRQAFDRHYFAEVGYSFNDRTSNEPGEGFRENVISVVFGYAFRP